MLGALFGATLIAFSGGALAAGNADGECAKGKTQCREAGREQHDSDLAPLKRQLFEFAGLPDRQRGPSPSLSRTRQAAERPLPGRQAWPVFGEGMGFLGHTLSSRLLGLIGWFGSR
ncbi:hypothetical protein AT959_00455 [Dechloromonas denitrificans]|uniref:Uncharacterized protein n=1 Tax=Dechloromonas denitrificans TaxID=281362 RepID=A0A133XP44_9RHOO|nr:hypothetical protein AT959_00455 [Dechloromonas denitrificans]